MSEKLGSNIDNSEVIVQSEDLDTKILRENILNKVIKNSTSIDYKKNYDYFKSLNIDKLEILNSLSIDELKIVQKLLLSEGNNSNKIFESIELLNKINRTGGIMKLDKFKKVISDLNNTTEKVSLIDIDLHISKIFIKNNKLLFNYLGVDNPIEGEKKEIDEKYLDNLNYLFGEEEVIKNYLYFDEDISNEQVLGTRVGNKALLFNKNIEKYYNGDYQEYGKLGVELPTIEEFRNITIVNELVHLNLVEKYNFQDKNTLEKGLEKINTGIENYKTTNLEIHEFLSDVGSMTISGKDALTRIHNVLTDTKLVIDESGNLDFNGEPINNKGYKYSYKFILKLLNDIFDFNISDFVGKNRKEVEKYIVTNLKEEDFLYIRENYIKQGKIWVNAIKNLKN